MWVNDETLFYINLEKTNNENDSENNNENKDEVNKIKINFLNFLNFSALCRLTESFSSKLKLKIKFTL